MGNFMSKIKNFWQGEADTEPKTDTAPAVEPKADTEPKTEPATDVKPKTDVEPATEPEPKAEPATDVEPKDETEPKAESEPEPADVEPETEPEPKADEEPEAEPEPEPKADDTDVATEAEPKLDTDPVTEPEPEPVVDLDKPERRLVTSIEEDWGYVVGFSIQGRSHIAGGTPCEDYHAYKELAPGWKLLITSDGAGSARESARGSKANCDLAVRLVSQLVEQKKWVENNYMPTELEWFVEMRNLFAVIQHLIITSAAKQADAYKAGKEAELKALEEQIAQTTDDIKLSKLKVKRGDIEKDIAKPLEARDFNATIILMLLTPQGMLTAHIGDGRMGYKAQDGTWKALMTPHKGDEASATVFIPNNWNDQRCVPAFTMSGAYLPDVRVVKELPQAVVLMSDGCENITWSCYAQDKESGRYYDPNTPFAGFFEPLLEEMNAAEDKDARADRLIDIINVGTRAGKSEHDDRTMLLGVLK